MGRVKEYYQEQLDQWQGDDDMELYVMSQKSRYVCGYNMPGCLPENEPFECEDIATAKDVLMAEMEMHSAQEHDDNLIIEYDDAVQFVARATGCISIGVGNWVYWIDLMEV